jgi:tetratricopeptide (TPR) repeat protein
VISDERHDWAYARFDLARPPQITYDPVQMLEHLEANRLEYGALFANTVTHAGLLRSFVQDFPLNTLMGLTGESIGAVQLHDADWNRIFKLNDRAARLTEQGKRHEAIALYRKSLELADEQLNILHSIAQLQTEVLDYRAAADNWRRWIQILPGEPDGYMALGGALAQIGDEEAAIAAWDEASKRRPTDLAVQRSLGWALFDIGAWEASVQALERALTASPSPSPAEARAIEHKLGEARSRAIERLRARGYVE